MSKETQRRSIERIRKRFDRLEKDIRDLQMECLFRDELEDDDYNLWSDDELREELNGAIGQIHSACPKDKTCKTCLLWHPYFIKDTPWSPACGGFCEAHSTRITAESLCNQYKVKK